jgi:hypothetical protein
MYHGLVLRALIAFSTSFDGWTGSQVVGYYSFAGRLPARSGAEKNQPRGPAGKAATVLAAVRLAVPGAGATVTSGVRPAEPGQPGW